LSMSNRPVVCQAVGMEVEAEEAAVGAVAVAAAEVREAEPTGEKKEEEQEEVAVGTTAADVASGEEEVLTTAGWQSASAAEMAAKVSFLRD
jgi:hypothetical protein